jgi:hypothetical protein
MKTSKSAAWVSAAVALGFVVLQVPPSLQAGDQNPFATTAPTTQSEWSLKNPDAQYAIASDICSGLSNAQLTTQAMSSDPDQSKSAIDQLRDKGQAGLDALLEANQSEVAVHRHGTNTKTADDDKKWQRIRAVIDAVAAQRDAYASGLFWYTDLTAAKAAARASGKPILSLRLLGNLNDEYSCANSRFFRTVLYANADVANMLRENFVLYWQSVRPVPVITIDFGDGRKIRRTITGNSIHYVLTADGTVVDGIPGLYGPKAFLRILEADGRMAATLKAASQKTDLRAWHAQQAAAIASACEADLKKISATPVSASSAVAAPPDEINWNRIAALHADDALLDRTSADLAASKNPDAATAAPRAFSKLRVESPLVRMVANFERSIAQDTVRNEYLFHIQIHRWLADPSNDSLAGDVSALNKRVYAELFLTPDNDPWLGLVPADTYSALDDDGVCR